MTPERLAEIARYVDRAAARENYDVRLPNRDVADLLAEVRALNAANASLVPGAMLTAVEIECLRVERDAARAEVARLTESADRDAQEHSNTIDQRDAREEQIAEAAQILGCEDEWSNCHDHGKCLIENASGVTTEIARLSHEVSRLTALLAPPTADRITALRTALEAIGVPRKNVPMQEACDCCGVHARETWDRQRIADRIAGEALTIARAVTAENLELRRSLDVVSFAFQRALDMLTQAFELVEWDDAALRNEAARSINDLVAATERAPNDGPDEARALVRRGAEMHRRLVASGLPPLTRVEVMAPFEDAGCVRPERAP